VLWIERFDTLQQLRSPIRHFARDHNEHRLLERHGHRTPRHARDALRHAPMTLITT
jgi:putative transposase